MFEHRLFPRVEITDITTESGRVYETPDGLFRSVTTRIGECSDKGWLDEWRSRVGHEEASRLTHQAGIRGTAVHSIAERYVMNDPDWKKGAMPVNLATFLKMKRVLDQNVDVIYGVEYPLWSKHLRTAGKSDLPCRFKGKDCIVDFKTSRSTKRREDIEGYFIQSAAYALMFRERTGLKVNHVAILIAEDQGDCSVFEDRVSNWLGRVQDVFMRP